MNYLTFILLIHLIISPSFASFRCDYDSDSNHTVLFDSASLGLTIFTSGTSLSGLSDCQSYLRKNVKGLFYCSKVSDGTVLFSEGGNTIMKFTASNHEYECQNYLSKYAKGDFLCQGDSSQTTLFKVTSSRSNSRSVGLIMFDRASHKSDCQNYLINNISN